jgi:multidrug transporter EmrE-like cation transporter
MLILFASLNSTIGNLLLKQSRIADVRDLPWFYKFASPYFVGAIAFYVVNLGLFAKALDNIPVSIGYPILAGSGFAMLVIASHILFREQVGYWQMCGLALVVGGLALLARDS